MSFSLWLAFVAVALVVSISPGPGAAATTAAAVNGGFAAGLRVALGLQIGLLLELAAAAAGVGAVLAASETAFVVLRSVGAAYLIWLGISAWRGSQRMLPAATGSVGSLAAKGWVRRGILVNLSNPKAILYIAALVPQFVIPDAPQLPQYFAIAATMVAIDGAVMFGYALLGVRLTGWLASPGRQRLLARIFGAVFVALGAALLVSGGKS
ncbi:LysE family transporter [Rhodocyclus purpureus]|uniref:LysE family transporter n=1 Tax=Rhodocyclus purpureus TaxID=1067 RepID=UPI00191409C8|nr:LysE family transporter [Rhodocyclus purpureus]MBK5913251.1 hypothetical protein [Rhodocyclus purpureus]